MKRLEESRRFAGPSLLTLAVVHVLLFAASMAAGTILRHGQIYPSPYGPIENAQRFFFANSQALRWSAFFFFGSAVPLGIYAATVLARLRFLGVRAAGTCISFFGGLMASAAIAASALCSWVLSVPEVNSSVATLRLMHFLSFLTGGVTFAVGFGLLAAGVSVTGFFAHLLPRWLVVFGLFIALAGELSFISLIAYPMSFALPVTRFGGFFWLMAVGATLPRVVGVNQGSISKQAQS